MMNCRICTKDDIPLMCQMRMRQLTRDGIDPGLEIDTELVRFFTEKLDDGSLVEWFLEDDGEIIATAGILFIQLTPSYSHQRICDKYVYCPRVQAERDRHLNASQIDGRSKSALRK